MIGCPLIKQGPKAGYTACVDCYRLPSGDWEVCLSLTLDIHGRSDETHRQTFRDCMAAYRLRDAMNKSIEEMGQGPLITPVTA